MFQDSWIVFWELLARVAEANGDGDSHTYSEPEKEPLMKGCEQQTNPTCVCRLAELCRYFNILIFSLTQAANAVRLG
jgi:hypothetical protein